MGVRESRRSLHTALLTLSPPGTSLSASWSLALRTRQVL
eukprot:CAMPEP_0171083256 /NCGR_PEP_ID=MMETSP0766_2-20121228/17607_1 /TAXON_ID=439317 /ORGANISM="Gambierdiscus australes, Strain CAWD 149" /LENGTH=38 /DNA_ID= /DNA_START= /DNA_END= /DNA_ORIENTATION=